jgi:amino acid permease
LLSLLIAVSFDDLGVVFGVIGSTGSTLVIFILPGLFYYLMHRTPPRTEGETKGACDDDEDQLGVEDGGIEYVGEAGSESVRVARAVRLAGLRVFQPQWKLYAALGMLVIGAVLMPLCLTMLFLYK